MANQSDRIADQVHRILAGLFLLALLLALILAAL